MTNSNNWSALQNEAFKASQKAYAPYSNYPVGAAAITSDRKIVTGCNIENASYGLTLCAECSLITNLIMGGGGKIKKFVCVNSENELIMPCGRCRQLLQEHADPEFLIQTPHGILTMRELLPYPFNKTNLS